MNSRTAMVLLSAIGLAGANFFSLGAWGANVTYENSVLSDGATAYYPLDDAVNSATATDLAPAHNTGTVLSGITLGSSSAMASLNTAAADNGGGAIIAPHNGVFDVGTGAFTIEMWFKNNVNTRGDLFTYKNGASDFGIQSNSNPGDETVSYYHNAFLGHASNVTDNAWHYLVVTRDASDNVNIYVDNTLQATGFTDTTSINNTDAAYIGSNHDLSAPENLAISLDGSVDEFAFYPSVLSTAQMGYHFAGVPEPASLGLLGIGGLGLLARRRRA